MARNRYATGIGLLILTSESSIKSRFSFSCPTYMWVASSYSSCGYAMYVLASSTIYFYLALSLVDHVHIVSWSITVKSFSTQLKNIYYYDLIGISSFVHDI